MDTDLEKECRQAVEWQMKLDASSKPNGIPNSQLISAICAGIIPVIKKHVLREIARGTDPLKRRVLELEIKQHRAIKSGPVKLIEPHRRVKCMF